MVKSIFTSYSISKDSWVRLSFFVSLAFAMGLFLLVYLNLDKGFNLNDESMYIYCITYPERLFTIVSNFGSFLHPIFMALEQDLHLFRIFTFLSLIVAASVLVISFLLLCKRHVRFSCWMYGALFFALWVSVLGYYTLWLPTASYNTVALVGIFGIITSLIFYTLLCRPYAKGHVLSMSTWNKYLKIGVLLLLAFFGVLAFIGKATTSAGMGLIACMWLYFCSGAQTPRQRILDIIFAGISAVIMLVIYLFIISDGIDTIDKLLGNAKLMDSSYDFKHTLSFYVDYFFPIYGTVLATWPLWAMALWATHKKKYRLAVIVCGLIICISFVTSYVWIANYTIALILWPLLVMLCIALVLWRKSWQHARFAMVLSLTFFASIFMFHAGTNTNFEYKASESLVLLSLSIVSLCMGMKPSRRDIVLPGLAIILCCSTLCSLFYSIFEPTRHNDYALWELTEPVELKPNTHPIYVHAERKLFVEWFQKTAKDHGWQAGNPLINTSFNTSGSLFLLDGFKMEGTWQIQERYTAREMYPSIMSFASSQDLKKAWIIKPVKDGPRHMPAAVLKEIGLPFPEGYELLSTSPIESMKGSWPEEQYEIWKPKE